MKYINCFVVLMITSMITSCQNKEQKKESASAPEIISNNIFKVGLNILVEENDDFCLLYTEDGSINFEKGIWQEVKGSPSEQVVQFYIPENVFPTQIRIDLGKNKILKNMVLKSVTFEYNGKTRIIAGTELQYFFRADDSKCTFNPTTGIIKALVKDGVRQNPSLYPHEATLQLELEKLAY